MPFLVAAVVPLLIHRQARLRDDVPPLPVAVATGLVLGFVLAEVGLLVAAAVAGVIGSAG